MRTRSRSGTLILALALTVSAFARSGAIATLTGSGSVLINSVRAPQSTAIFDGDTVQTQANSSATLVMRGATAVLSAESTAFISDGMLELRKGFAVITTLAAVRVRVAGCTIRPDGTLNTRFTAQNTNGQVTIRAQRGKVILTHLGQSTALNAGQTASLDSTASQSFVVSNKLPTRTLTGAAVAGGSAAGVTLATRHKRDTVSPVQP